MGMESCLCNPERRLTIAGVPQAVSERRIHVRELLVAAAGASMGDACVQPYPGLGAILAGPHPHCPASVHILEVLEEVFETPLEQAQSQK